MLNLPMEMDQLRQSPVHRYAQLWRIERPDGVTFRFTDHDTPITFNYEAALNSRQQPGASGNGQSFGYLGTDTSTGTNWYGKYGNAGYGLFDGSSWPSFITSVNTTATSANPDGPPNGVVNGIPGSGVTQPGTWFGTSANPLKYDVVATGPGKVTVFVNYDGGTAESFPVTVTRDSDSAVLWTGLWSIAAGQPSYIQFKFTESITISISPNPTTGHNPEAQGVLLDVYVGDEVYLTTDSVSTTAMQKQSGMQDHNIDVQAVISSSLITESDLRAGKYRNARVVSMLIDWRYPYAGYFTHNIFWIISTAYTRETWHAQISSTPIRFRKDIGHLFTHECRWDLGDNNCQVNLASFTSTGTVTVVSDPRTFVASGTTTTNDYYDDGQLTWVTGNNAHTTVDVANNVGATFTLQLNSINPIQVGDTFTVIAGCNKLKNTCSGTFNNFARFGGFPFIPGNDAIIRGNLG